MKLTKELLIKLNACQHGIDFCERNKLFGFELDNLSTLTGDYNNYVSWLLHRIKKGYVYNDSYNQKGIGEPPKLKGFITNYVYDEVGNILSCKDEHGKYIKEYIYTYYPNGQLKSCNDLQLPLICIS